MKWKYPRNIVNDIIENIESSDIAEKCSVKYACENFDKNVRRSFAGLPEDQKNLCLDFYKNQEVDEKEFADQNGITPTILRKIIGDVIKVFAHVDNFAYFFIDEESIETTNKLQEKFLELNEEYMRLNAELQLKIARVKKEIEMLDVREPRAKLENFKLITSKERIDILEIKDVTKSKLRINKIEFINQLIVKTEDEILNILGLTEREAYDIFRALGKLGYNINH